MHQNVADLSIPPENPVFDLALIVRVGGIQRLADLGGDQMRIVGVDEQAGIVGRRNLVTAFPFGGGAVEGIEDVIEDEKIRRHLVFPVHQVGQIHGLGELQAVHPQRLFRQFALGDVEESYHGPGDFSLFVNQVADIHHRET